QGVTVRRVHTTFDLLEAHIVAALLREHGIEAWAFDVDFVRLNWFEMQAFGGFRVVASDASVGDAAALVQEYRNGNLSIAQGAAEVCPHCGTAAPMENPQPRRNVFIAFIVFWLAQFPLLFEISTLWKDHAVIEALLLAASPLVLAVIALLALPYFKWPMRC